ncbi:MAG: M20/M25/M40 family metallo-hydrolase [Gemmatimonadota bacterium]
MRVTRLLIAALLLPLSLRAQRAPVPRAAVAVDSGSYRVAALAWEHGDFIGALDGFARIMATPLKETFRDSIALVTGELYQTRELTQDGSRPAFSPKGTFASYETGPITNRVTRIVRSAPGLTPVREVGGAAAAISPSDTLVAFLAQRGSGPAQLVVQQLVSGATVPVAGMESWRPTGVVFGATDAMLFVVAAPEGDNSRNEILRLERRDAGYAVIGPVAAMNGFKSAPLPLPGGRYLVHAVVAGNPVRLPSGAAGIKAAASFAIVDLVAGTSRWVNGSSASVSADGSAVTYLVKADNGQNSVVVEPIAGGAPVVVKRATEQLANPALSPDGSRVVFQMMPTYDWELYLIGADGKNEVRLTREIQHDLFPVWLNQNKLLAVIGEARHRRSYIYDATTLQRTRLFHNNTVRTIAPEYEWVVSADGCRVLIVAERDGNTVSPERGVYLTDLDLTVSDADLLARIRGNRAAEVSLRDRGLATFKPIAAQVRQVTSQVDVARIFGYEKSLFDFDSKHISQPGNAKAIDYLLKTYRTFGYVAGPQWFSPPGALGGKSANVLAVLKGTEHPELVYVVSSHFDSRAEGPGADDNTSGTAALLEAARVLAAHPQPATIIFASFTGEEAGLLGSREFVRRAVADSVQVVGALNNDMLGWTNDGRLDNTIRYSNPGIRDIQHAAAQQFSQMITYDALYYKSTDAAAYYEAYGDIVGGIGSYPVLGNPHYHMSHDVLEFENHQLIAEASKTTVATLMLLASSPSRLGGLALDRLAGGTAEIHWNPSREGGVARYEVTWGPESDPMAHRLTTLSPKARLVGAAPGMVVQVRAVNRRGLAGWDWARLRLNPLP